MHIFVLLNFFLLSSTHSLDDSSNPSDGAHHCIQDQIVKFNKQNKIQPIVYHDPGLPVQPADPARTLKKRQNSPKIAPHHDPIRFHVVKDLLMNDAQTCYDTSQTINTIFADGNYGDYQCSPSDVLTQSKLDYLVDVLLVSAMDFLGKTLRVFRSTEKLRLNVDSCSAGAFTVNVPSVYLEDGVDTDFIILPTARPIIGGGTLAFAVTCATNNIGRPIAGYINFNASSLSNVPNDFYRQRSIVIHELMHSLGFTELMFYNFIEYTGFNEELQKWEFRNLRETEISDWHSTPDGYTTKILITPTIVETVRHHYNCSTLDGCQLEDGGDVGTYGSHIEKRLFMNDFMTGSDSENPVISNISFAILADSGWYEVDYTYTEPLLWGKNMGCGFLEDCGGWTKLPVVPSGFCDASTDPTEVFCTFDRTAYGYCNIKEKLSYVLPEEYRHYGNSRTGGQSALADNCGYVGQRGTTVYCRLGNENSVQQLGDAIKPVADTGERFLPTSRCMYSTISKAKDVIDSFSGVVSTIFTPSLRSARCFNTSCVDSNDLRVQIDDRWYACNDQNVQPFGFVGFIQCPPASEICAGTKRDITWPRIQSVYPKRGPPSTVITIKGYNFDVSPPITVTLQGDCDQVTIVDKYTITARIPGGDYFVGFNDLAMFQTKKDLIIKDNRGYTAQIEKAFTIEVAFDGNYFFHVINWMADYPLWGFLTWTVILIPICICCGFFYRCLYISRENSGLNIFQTEFRDDFSLDDMSERADTLQALDQASSTRDENTTTERSFPDIFGWKELKEASARRQITSAGIDDPRMPGLKEYKFNW